MNFKRILSLILSICMMLTIMSFPATAATTGETDDGLTYSISNGEVTITGYVGSATELTIPSTIEGYPVTTIGYFAFEYCSSLTDIDIPDSVTSISASAFYYCKNLTTIDIPDSVTSIGSYAFYSCSKLANIDLGTGVTTIGDYAFEYCSSLTDIDIPDSVTTIGDKAFYNCSNLTSITLGKGVTTIGASAFYSCSKLANIDLGTGVTTIGDHAFEYCSSLTDIDIPDSVTSIGSYAFYSCSKLANIDLGTGVTTIGDRAFSKCSNLTIVDIPDSVTSIDADAFDECISLTSINVGQNNKFYFSQDGVLFEKREDEVILMLYPIGKVDTEYAIPNGVTSIGYSAFMWCSNLTNVTIANSVTSIEAYAFYSCSKLANINIPDNLTSIDSYTFYDCSKLTSIDIPDSVTTIGDRAFYNCSNLTSINIPNGVIAIGSAAFYKCSNLTSIDIPDSVTSIGASAFNNCFNLTSITVGPNNESYFSQDEVLFEKREDEVILMLYPAKKVGEEYVVPNSVTSIGASAFYYCKNLTNIDIPDSVTSIGSYAFYSCSKLANIDLGTGVTTIGDYAFEYCSSLTDIDIPDSVTSIDSYTFYGCSSLTNIDIPDSVTSIGKNAFYSCSKLANIDLGTGVTTIGDYAFEDCVSLISIDIPDSVTSIGSFAFYSCFKLADIDLGTGVTTIGKYAFSDCSSLTSIDIPDSVTSIASYTFCGCSNLTSITLGKGVTTIGASAFYKCDKIFEICYKGTKTQSSTISKGTNNYPLTDATWYYALCNDGNEHIYDNTCDQICNICNEIRKVGDHVYSNESDAKCNVCGSLRSVTGLTETGFTYTIDSEGFVTIDAYMGSASKLVVPSEIDGYPVTAIEMDAFRDSSSLISVDIPYGITEIGSCAFYNCKNLKSIEIPDSVTSLGYYMFDGCTSLESVKLSNSIEWIYEKTFAGCTSLTTIEIPGSVRCIDYYAFDNCTSLTSVTIENGVKAIHDYAFRNCTDLTTISIPNSVTNISSSVFHTCNKLVDVCYDGTLYQAEQIYIGSYNTPLTNATWHFFDAGCDTECNDCGKEFPEKLSHSYVVADVVLPTCEKNGYTTYTCEWCADTYDGDFVSPDGHKLDSNHKCTVCGEQFTAPLKKYTIHIFDYNTGKSIKGATVSLNGEEMRTNSYGVAEFQIEDITKGTLKVKANGYPEYVVDNYQIVSTCFDRVMMESNDYAITKAICNDRNVILGKTQINTQSFSLTAEISVGGRTKDRIDHYELVQNGTIIATSTDGDFEVPNMHFKTDEDVYVRMYTVGQYNDNQYTNIFQKKINIEVVGFSFDFTTDLEKFLPFSLGFGFSFPDGTPGLSETSISFNGLFADEDELSLSVGNDKIILTYGAEYDFSEKELNAKDVKELFKEITDDWVKERKTTKKTEVSASMAFVIEFSGTEITKAYGQMTVGFNLERGIGQTFWVGIIPVYGEVEFNLNGEAKITNIGYDYANAKWLIPGLRTKLGAGLTLYAGLGCKVASVGVYGKGTIELILDSRIKGMFESVTVSGELGVYAKAKILFFKEAKYMLPLLQGSHTWWSNEVQTAVAQKLYSMSSYTTSVREYLDERSEWLNISLMSNDSTLVFLQDSTYDSIQPRIVTSGDTTMMLFFDDDGSEGSNYQHLYYSLYDKASGTWSNPQRVDTNDRCDVEFDVYADENGIYVAYTEIDNIAEGDMNNYEEILGSVEVVVTEYNFENGEFTNHTSLTSNDTFDTMPDISKTEEGVIVVWVNNSTNDAFTQNADNVVYISTLTNGTWTDEKALTEKGASVVSIDVGTLNGNTYVATICDVDCDYSTVDDRLLYLVDLDGNVTQIVNQEESNDAVQFIEMNGDEQLIWYNGSNLYSIDSISDTPVAMFDSAVEGFTSNYKFLQVDSDTYAVLFAKNEIAEDGEGNSVDGSNVYGIFYSNGTWGGAVPVTNNEPGYYVDAYDAFMNDGEVVIPYINAEVTITGTDINKRCSFLSTSFELRNDLVVGQAEYLPSQLFEGDKITLDVPVTNNSWQKLTGVSYAVLDSNGNTVLSGSLAKEIESGTTDYITFDLQKSLLTTGEIYTVYVEAEDWSENDISNNASTVDVWYTDFSITASQMALGDVREIHYAITNEGNIGDTATLRVYKRSSDGSQIVITEEPISTVGVGETISGSLTVTSEYYSNGSNTGVVILEVVSDKDKIYLFNDSTSVTVGGIEQTPTTEVDASDVVIEGPVANQPYVKYDEDSTNASVTVDEKGWSFVGVNELTTQDYSYSNSTLTIKADFLATLTKGYHSYTLTYSNSGKTTEVLIVIEKTYNPHTEPVIYAENQNFKYDGNALKLGTDVIYYTDSQGTVSVQYSANNGTSWISGLPTEIGTYLVKLTVAQDDENEYLSTNYTFTIAIEKGVRAVSAPVVIGTANAQVQFGNSTVTAGKGDGKILYGYSLTDDASTVTEWSESGTLPNAQTPTIYYIFAKAVNGTNYEDTYSIGYAVDAHIHEYVSTIVPATKEQDGYTLHTCSTCKHEYKDNYTPYYIPGDVNNDGFVTNKDFSILRQHLNGWNVTINLLAADVNRDGVVNNKDMGILRQYLNHWDVVLK